MNKIVTFIVVLICGMALGVTLVNLFAEEESASPKQEQGESEVWTCTMHSEIKEDTSGLCPKCNMELTPLDQDLSSLDPKLFQQDQHTLALIMAFVA